MISDRREPDERESGRDSSAVSRSPGATEGRASPDPGDRGRLACVVDTHPRFSLEAIRWFASARRIAGVDPGDLTVHVVGAPRADVTEYLRQRGVAVDPVSPFDARSPHCNKISGALSLAAQGLQGLHVLCDTDVLIFEDPRLLEIPPDHVAMTPVDLPNPPVEVLSTVFAAAGVGEPEQMAVPYRPGTSTLSGNGNGGLYLVPGGILPDVAEGWARWARWLLDRIELLQRWDVHVDQVSMALALASQGIGVTQLPPNWNVPTHIDGVITPETSAPASIHYHQQVDPIGQVLEVGAPAVDDMIRRANAATAEVWQEHFPNSTFWEWRYSTNPKLGSGVGSRGGPLRRKRRLLKSVLRAVAPTSVLDVGCGDGEATRGLDMPGYIGIDASAASVANASMGRPDGTHLVGSLADHPVEADLTICLDVLIHQADASAYRDLVERLVRSARRALLVSGYERRPTSDSPMVYFHESLTATISRYGAALDVRELREEHEISMLLVLKAPLRRALHVPGLRVLGRAARESPR